MISIKAGRHDDRSVEFKFGFSEKDNSGKPGRYAVNTWIFIPGSLDIDPETYGKDQFYRDIKSNFRLITPVFGLDEIATGKAVPLKQLRNAVDKLAAEPSPENEAGFEYHIKMFSAIYKSALRDHARAVIRAAEGKRAEELALGMVRLSRHILDSYRELLPKVSGPGMKSDFMNYFLLGDEFMSRQTDLRAFRVLKKVRFDSDSRAEEMLNELITRERQYKRAMHFETFEADEPQKNSRLVYRYGMLKKYIESELYIRLKKKRDGFAVEQIYYSLAAGLAMIFATGVAWAFQLRYGNITTPLFVALVISYMLKDRIKELMRYYFAHKRLNRYFDHKAHIRIRNQDVGTIKEGVDFISESHTPEEVMKLRLSDTDVPFENRIFEERILLYRKLVEIDHGKLNENASYPVDGINEIFRLHVNRFTLKMDNPEIPVEAQASESDTDVMEVQKYYKVHIVVQMKDGDDVSYRQFRLMMTRDGIISVE